MLVSFEELNEAGKPKFWEESSKGGWFVSTDESFEGKVSMRATVAWSSLWQEIPVESEKFYKLKVCVKSDIKEGENALLTLEGLDNKGKMLPLPGNLRRVQFLLQKIQKRLK